MNKNERRFIGKGLYWTIVIILFVLIATVCLGLMNIASTPFFVVGLIGLVTAGLYFLILVKREVCSGSQDEPKLK